MPYICRLIHKVNSSPTKKSFEYNKFGFKNFIQYLFALNAQSLKKGSFLMQIKLL